MAKAKPIFKREQIGARSLEACTEMGFKPFTACVTVLQNHSQGCGSDLIWDPFVPVVLLVGVCVDRVDSRDRTFPFAFVPVFFDFTDRVADRPSELLPSLSPACVTTDGGETERLVIDPFGKGSLLRESEVRRCFFLFIITSASGLQSNWPVLLAT